jgi:peptidoglycan/LPS O-acetylase OafA/YrhL
LAAPAQIKELERVKALDGVRGAAILMVVVYHFFGVQAPDHPTIVGLVIYHSFALLWCGVDLFFVLSGFLITGILLDTKGAANYFSVFYARRALRILPLYYAAVFALFVAVPFAAARAGLAWPRIAPGEQVWYWLHISNWRTAFHPGIYIEANHFWSLAIEEQFYFVWPAIVLICSRRGLMRLCIASILGCFLLRNLPVFQTLNAQYPSYLNRMTPFRVDSLLFGACSALIVRDARWSAIAQRHWRTAFVLGLAGIAIAVASGRSTASNTASMTGLGYTSLALTFAAVLLYVFWHNGSSCPVPRLCRSPVMTHLGKHSYAIYVVHLPLALHLIRPAALVGTYVLSIVLRICLERHFLRLRGRFAYR